MSPPNDSSSELSAADLVAYFGRIGYDGSAKPDLVTLNALAAAHVQSIPFENLDVLAGRNISLELNALMQKLVHSGRGGYCFENNGLFLAVLERLGYRVWSLSARVRLQRPRTQIPPRTHQFNVVDLEGKRWLVDVGIGGVSLACAILLKTNIEQVTPHEPRRITCENGVYFHQVRFENGWNDVCEFTGEEMPPIDRELSNWYTSTHPKSHFKDRLMVARAAPDGVRLSIDNNQFTRRKAGQTATVEPILSPEQLLQVLEKHFGVVLPAGTKFDYPNSPWS